MLQCYVGLLDLKSWEATLLIVCDIVLELPIAYVSYIFEIKFP